MFFRQDRPVSTHQSKSDKNTAIIIYKYNPNVFGFVKMPAYLPPSYRGRNKKEITDITANDHFMAFLKHCHNKSFLVWFCHTKNTAVKTKAKIRPSPHIFFGTRISETVKEMHIPNQAIQRERLQWIWTNVRSSDNMAMANITKIPQTVL